MLRVTCRHPSIIASLLKAKNRPVANFVHGRKKTNKTDPGLETDPVEVEKSSTVRCLGVTFQRTMVHHAGRK